MEHRSKALRIQKIRGEVVIDGELDDSAWQQVEAVRTWFETNPGDNLEPKVANEAYLTYDDRFLYAAFRFSDPEPLKIRAPFGDRDNVPSTTDYGGLFIDANGDGKTAQMFLANPRGIQYDAINSDVSGEDSSPDFFWESAARITADGWNLEIRVPFSSLRYEGQGEGDWGVMLYRNYPRDFRYQMFTSRLPRDVSCFICNLRPLQGLSDLPTGGHLVVAPFVAANQRSEPEGELGSSLDRASVETEPGLDVKWLPNPQTAVDFTLNPDFSQVESDTAQIGANERFALFFPEKRSFFLEGIDLFDTPVQAVYTRTFTAPRWGVRTTGKRGNTVYTVLLGEDEGGGSVVLPGATGSGLADQDFSSTVALGRVRQEFGQSFISFLATAREIDDGGHNRVFGPDFQWRPNDVDWITGQVLFSVSETPNRPELADEWDGRELSGHAAFFEYWHGDGTWDYLARIRDIDEDFRADNGFVPKVGVREGFAELGRTVRPTKGFLNRIRTFAFGRYETDQDGRILRRMGSAGAGMSGRYNSFFRFRLETDDVESDRQLFSRRRFFYTLEGSPTRRFSRVRLDGDLGDGVDFGASRSGDGGNIRLSATVRPTDRLELRFNVNRRWLDVDALDRGEDSRPAGRLFTAHVGRVRATYTFNSRTFVRLIGQYVETERDPSLYLSEVDAKSGDLNGSFLFAYKLNWQTLLFLGWSENRELDPSEQLQRSGDELFLKVSYAWQR